MHSPCHVEEILVLFRSVYIVYTLLGHISVYVVGKDEYDVLACKCIHSPSTTVYNFLRTLHLIAVKAVVFCRCKRVEGLDNMFS